MCVCVSVYLCRHTLIFLRVTTAVRTLYVYSYDMIQDQSPEGEAQRLRQEQEEARKRAEKLGILVDSDFEFAAGTAAANMGRKTPPLPPPYGAAAVVDGNKNQAPTASSAAAAAATPATGGDREELQEEEEKEEKKSKKERENELEEEERRARAELKNKKQYGQDMTAIAMGHPEAAKGEGKVMSMGSSTYVMDRVRQKNARGRLAVAAADAGRGKNIVCNRSWPFGAGGRINSKQTNRHVGRPADRCDAVQLKCDGLPV